MSALPAFTAAQLESVAALLPEVALQLVSELGATAACALLNGLPGCELRIPKGPAHNAEGARRWQVLVACIGEAPAARLMQRWGGDALYVPICQDARRELRDRAIRAEFDRMTLELGLSGREAVYEIGLAFAPISNRQIEKICGRTDAAPVQDSLF